MQVGSLASFKRSVTIIVVQYGDFVKPQDMTIHHDANPKGSHRFAIDKGFSQELNISFCRSIIAQAEGKHVVDGSGLADIKTRQRLRTVRDGHIF